VGAADGNIEGPTREAFEFEVIALDRGRHMPEVEWLFRFQRENLGAGPGRRFLFGVWHKVSSWVSTDAGASIPAAPGRHP
jgi:hypothetical protein